MTFIRHGFKIGERVRLKKDMELGIGTYTKGHEFKVVSWHERGYDLVDDDGNEIQEVGIVGGSMNEWFEAV